MRNKIVTTLENRKVVARRKVVAKPIAKKKPIAKENPIVEIEKYKMYLNFPSSKTETPQSKPTKITILLQSIGFLDALVPNCELLQSLIKLIKVFILCGIFFICNLCLF